MPTAKRKTTKQTHFINLEWVLPFIVHRVSVRELSPVSATTDSKKLGYVTNLTPFQKFLDMVSPFLTRELQAQKIDSTHTPLGMVWSCVHYTGRHGFFYRDAVT